MADASHVVVTISRQLGSGGSFLGRLLAGKLHAAYADRGIISQVARQLAVPEADIAERDEATTSLWQSLLQGFSACGPDPYSPPPLPPVSDGEIFRAEAEVIVRIAAEGPAVIIGRCGFHALRGHPRHLAVFLHADAEFRSRRLQGLYGLSADEAGRQIERSDRQRAAYNRACTGRDWSDARQYDLSLDVGRMGLKGVAEIILLALAERGMTAGR